MSASTERKNRQLARNEGTDKKTVAARKEAEKKRKDKIKWIVIGIAVVIFFALVIYLNTGAFYRNLNALTVENTANEEYSIEASSTDYSVAEVNYMYSMQYMNILNSYGQYASYLGLDTSKPLDEQVCSVAQSDDANYTWHDYFLDSAKSQLTEMTVFKAYAESQNITLDKEDLATIDNTLDSIAESAKTNGYGSANKFLTANYGKGCNTDIVRKIIGLELLASKVQNTISDSFEFSASELTDYYATVKDSYDTFDYSYYLVEAEATTAEDGTTSVSADAAAKAKATAEKIMDAIKGSSFAKATAAIIGDVETTTTNEDGETVTTTGPAAPTEMKDIPGAQVEEALNKWMVSADRKAGDTAVIDSENVGSYVVVFTARDNNKHTTEESGDMNYCDYIADSLLRNEGLSDWHDSVFKGIEDCYTLNVNGAVRYVGR